MTDRKSPLRFVVPLVLAGGSVRIRTPDGKVVEHENVPAGTIFWSEAETHVTENISGSNIRSLLIELKKA